MSGFYDGLAATARKLIADKGVAIPWVRETFGEQDPVTLTATRTVLSFAPMGVEVSLPESEIDGTHVQRGDTKLLLSTSAGFEPRIGDTLTLPSGAAARCIRPRRIAPGGTVVIWSVVVRSGG